MLIYMNYHTQHINNSFDHQQERGEKLLFLSSTGGAMALGVLLLLATVAGAAGERVARGGAEPSPRLLNVIANVVRQEVAGKCHLGKQQLLGESGGDERSKHAALKKEALAVAAHSAQGTFIQLSRMGFDMSMDLGESKKAHSLALLDVVNKVVAEEVSA
jgi:hypothetical protein